jgi:hypothetical protein
LDTSVGFSDGAGAGINLPMETSAGGSAPPNPADGSQDTSIGLNDSSTIFGGGLADTNGSSFA